MNREQIETEIQQKGLAAPRVTLQSIEAKIASEHYFTANDGTLGGTSFDDKGDIASARLPLPIFLLTICVLVMKNGYTVVGTSACVSLLNFDAELGRKIARQRALEQLWPLEGYLLREHQFMEGVYFLNTPMRPEEAEGIIAYLRKRFPDTGGTPT